MYFNEFDPFAAAWLGNLFPDATIDQRSIVDVTADDLVQFKRAHFFSGIGGWELALHLAGWPDEWPIDTGSCPCQPFSASGQGKAEEDPRHLWPTWARIIRERHPECLVGEQVANAIGHGWLDGVFADLEAEGYTCGATVLGAHSIGAPHTRQRLFWVAYTSIAERRWRAQPIGEHRRTLHIADRCGVDGVANSPGTRYPGTGTRPAIDCNRTDSVPQRGHALGELAGGGSAHGVANLPRNGWGQGRENICGSNCGVREEGDRGGSANSEHDGRLANSASLRGAQQWNEPGEQSTPTPQHSTECGRSGGMANSDGGIAGHRDLQRCGEQRQQPQDGGSVLGLGNTECDGLRSGGWPNADIAEQSGNGAVFDTWARSVVVQCRDGKARRFEPGSFPLVDGVPKKLGRVSTRLEGMGFSSKDVKRLLRNPRSLLAVASRNRVGRLRGYGNAIVPELAALFIRAFIDEATSHNSGSK